MVKLQPGSFWHTAIGHIAIMVVFLLPITFTAARPILTAVCAILAAAAYGLGVAALLKYAPRHWKRPN